MVIKDAYNLHRKTWLLQNGLHMKFAKMGKQEFNVGIYNYFILK